MSRLQIKVVASGLTAFYGVCAVLGYGLHGFVACDAIHCTDLAHCTELACQPAADPNRAPQAADDCCCRHNHCGPEFHSAGDRTNTVRPTVKPLKRWHNPGTCSVCALLAQLRVGYAATNLSLESTHPPVEFKSEFDSSFSRSTIRMGEPRGPPLPAA